MTPRTIDDVLKTVPGGTGQLLPAPPYYRHGPDPKIGFAVPSMQTHTTDEGWQLFAGLQAGGYTLAGRGLDHNTTNVAHLFPQVFPQESPAGLGGTVVLQDKREWEGKTAGRGFDPNEMFRNVGVLKDQNDVFKGTVLKDAHRDNEYHRESADEIGAHFWVTYYHPRVVKHLAPYVRQEHLVRTYHSIDANAVPKFNPRGYRDNAGLLSGAISNVYPLRKRLWQEVLSFTNIYRMPHPGYGRDACHTPVYLQCLSMYKVAICTSSMLGYAVRKIIEATACGCRVITDLPVDDYLPGIDGNLVRVPPEIATADVSKLVGQLCDEYDVGRQGDYAEHACLMYDYRTQGRKLANDIEWLRKNYGGGR